MAVTKYTQPKKRTYCYCVHFGKNYGPLYTKQCFRTKRRAKTYARRQRAKGFRVTLRRACKRKR